MRRLHALGISAAFVAVWLLPVPRVAAQPITKSDKAAFQEDLNKLKKSRPAEFEQAKRLFTLAAELLLARLGYDVGPFDGLLDEKTATALRAYETRRVFPSQAILYRSRRSKPSTAMRRPSIKGRPFFPGCTFLQTVGTPAMSPRRALGPSSARTWHNPSKHPRSSVIATPEFAPRPQRS
jgi:hypothetical protein